MEDGFARHDMGKAALSARRFFRPVPIGLAIAASLAMVSLMPAAMLWIRAEHSSPATRPMSVLLADGSRAILDADSALSTDFDGKTRSLVLLKGRAWFSVRHGDPRPFRVHAGDGVTQDIGTAFAVETDRYVVRVGVTEGMVRVAGQTGAPVLLSAGGQARYDQGGRAVATSAVDPGLIAGWRRGELLVRSMPVETAIAQIARYRAAPVWIWGDLSGMAPVSGSFRTDRPDDAIQTLVVMRGLEQIRLPGGVLVLRAAPPK